MSPDPDTLAETSADAGGTALATVVRALAAVRPAAKPFHPRGTVLRGLLTRHGGAEPSGVPWLDEAGEDEVLVRLSRAVGLPRPLPDIFGLALRVPGARDGRPSDLLLATTGRAVPTRFLLTWHREGHQRVFTSLLPYRSASGPVVLGARRTNDEHYELAWARPTGGWTVFGRLTLGEEPGDDEPVSFDPVEHPLPGLDNYDWVRRLRRPSYLVARRSSGRPE
jgi:hypothetical protein